MSEGGGLNSLPYYGLGYSLIVEFTVLRANFIFIRYYHNLKQKGHMFFFFPPKFYKKINKRTYNILTGVYVSICLFYVVFKKIL